MPLCRGVFVCSVLSCRELVMEDCVHLLSEISWKKDRAQIKKMKKDSVCLVDDQQKNEIKSSA